MIPRSILTLIRCYRQNEIVNAMEIDWDEYHRNVSKWRTDPGYPMRPIKRSRSLNNFLHKIPTVSVLGSGSFGTVFKCEGKVIKVIRRSDRSYETFVTFCQNNTSPYLPKIEGPFIVRGLSFYIIEELKPHYDHAETDCRIIRRVINNEGSRLIDPELNRVCKLMAKMQQQHEYLNLDLHSDNVMYRGEQVVITDPWS